MIRTAVTLYLVVMCVIGFFQMLADKRRAQKGIWRISERALLMTAALGGAAGSLLGMYLFRHKTRHPRFTICVPIFLIIHVVLYVLMFVVF